MSGKKISNVELEQLVRKGMGVSEIARELKVTKGAVSKRLKALEIGIAKDVTLRSAPQIVDRQLNAMDQLKRINGLINNELNYIEKSMETATGEQRKELQEQRLKHVGEIRKQLSLLLDIASVLFNTEEIAKFQQIVIEVIGNASPETKTKILAALNARGAIRSTLGFA